MRGFLKKYAGPGILVLLEAALWLSGIRSIPLAAILLGVAIVWFIVVRFPSLMARVLRRAPMPPEPVPPPPPQALFAITLPKEPRPGNIDSYRTIVFENVYVVTESTRELRFRLTSPGREFLGFLEYQEIWRDHAAASADFAAKYMSNPAHIEHPNRSGHLAFVDKAGNRQGIEEWTLSIDTGLGRDYRQFSISAIGEWTCLSDGTVTPGAAS